MLRAARLLSGAATQRERAATALATYRVGHERAVAEVRSQLGENAYGVAYAKGTAMSTEGMVAYALGQAPPAIAPSPRHEPPTALTAREMEVSRLISEGMQTKQIAAKLFISERTVETHVTNIMNKLGLASRLQLARWVTSLEEAAVS
jgi:DNA-binding NarL/FixJ family response regulator